MKESLLLLIDISPTMGKILPEVEKICSMLLEKKLIYSKQDEVGVVLFGAEDTDNELTKELGGYEHVVVLRGFKVVDGDLVNAFHQLPRGTVAGDFIDAIVVGIDLMIKKYGPTNKGKKRVCLITDAMSPVKGPYEGTKADQVSIVAEQMSVQGMKFECIVVRENTTNVAKKTVINENYQLLDLISNKTMAKTVYVDDSVSLRGALRTRNIAPVTLFRGELELSSALKIKVWVYKKTAEEKFPLLKKYSDKAPPSDRFATHEVKLDYEYKSIEDSSRVVPPEQRIKGYRYGPHVVPISAAELEAVKFKPEKGVKLLGFTDSSNILRHYYTKDVNIFIAEPGNTSAMVAVSALARALKEMNKVAIVRCVFRQGQSNVVIGVLTPNVAEKGNTPDSFYFNTLPFAEDVREFQFPSFKNLPETMQPTGEQQDAADNFVKSLDLSPPDKAEILQPNVTPNPVLELYFHFLELRSKNPEASVPSLDNTLKKITEPDPELISSNKSIVETFRKCFELKENPKMKKSAKRLREKPSGSDDERDGVQRGKLDIKLSITGGKSSESTTNVDKIGDLTPVQDFEAILSRRDNPDWVEKAIKGMRNKILGLIEDSNNGDNYSKAVECLLALRRGCIVEQEPKQFNAFIQYICKYCVEHDLHDFVELLASKDMKLITKIEASDSDVGDDEAGRFLQPKQLKTEPKLELQI